MPGYWHCRPERLLWLGSWEVPLDQMSLSRVAHGLRCRITTAIYVSAAAVPGESCLFRRQGVDSGSVVVFIM